MPDTALVSQNWAFPLGFHPSQTAYGPASIPGTAYKGLGMWKKGQTWMVDKGTTSVSSSGSPVYAQIVDSAVAGMTGNGNVCSMFLTYWFAGTGNAVRAGSVIGAGTGFLNLVVGGVAVAAGLSTPSAPTFAATATASSKFNGVYACGVVAVRVTSGAMSNVSLRSAVISVKNLKGLITFPAAPTGATHWLIYGTAKGQGTVGVLRKVTTIAPVAVGTATLAVEWVDGELGDLAPITNDPPPACTHCFPLGGVMCVVSSGGMIYPSKVAQPEAYDVGQAVRLASGEAPVGITARGSDGGVFVGTRNSISLVVATGSDAAPVLPRGVFENVGIANGNAMCWVHDTLYVFSSKGGLVRTHGGTEPDSSFAIPQLKFFRDNGFTGSNTILVHDEDNGAVLVCSGSVAVPFMIATEDWSTPIPLPGSARAGIALNGAGLVDVGGTLYTLNTGSVSPGAWTMDLLGEGGTTIGGPFPRAFTPPHDIWLKGIINGIHSVSLKASCASGASFLESPRVPCGPSGYRKKWREFRGAAVVGEFHEVTADFSVDGARIG